MNNNKSYDTKRLTTCTLITTILAIMVLINVYVPMFFVFLPIPIVILFLRYDLKASIMSSIVSVIIISMMGQPIYALTSIIMNFIVGITLGYCIKNKKKFYFTLTLLAIVFIVAMMINLGIYTKLIMNMDLHSFINYTISNLNDVSKNVIQFYKSMGMKEEQLQVLTNAMNMANSKVFLLMMPGMIIVSAFIMSYLNYIITLVIIKKLRYNVNLEVPRVTHIAIDIKVATIVSILLLLGSLLSKKSIIGGTYVYITSKVILQYICLIQGVVVVAFYLINKFRVPRNFSILIIILTGFSALGNLYLAIGFLDLIFDFRKIKPKHNVINK